MTVDQLYTIYLHKPPHGYPTYRAWFKAIGILNPTIHQALLVARVFPLRIAQQALEITLVNLCDNPPH